MRQLRGFSINFEEWKNEELMSASKVEGRGSPGAPAIAPVPESD
jgi:hypothetical protein